ncbi:MAG: hypothetical protein IJI07_12615 [Flexilinea sp.]|nr:hypothetical protein [Flexilinea sp.]
MEEKKSSTKKVIIIVIVLLLLIGLILFLILRSSPSETETAVSIATIWMADDTGRNDGQLDWDSVPEYISRERIGFIRGKTAAAGSVKIRENLLSETAENTEITGTLADMINAEDILMVIGASGDLPTMYAAMETDFFGIPMLIPYSDGDIVSDSSAGYTVRMTPTDNNYADYIGKELLPSGTTDWIFDGLFGGGPLPDDAVDAAVFFADNFNGHDLAVAITQRLMDNGIDIDHYHPYQGYDLYSGFEDAWKEDEESLRNIDLVFIIGYDQDPMYDLGRVTELWKDIRDPEDQPLFILLAYAPTSMDPKIYEKNNIYVIRQHLDMFNCPAEIVYHDEAIAYASGWITGTAIRRASERQDPEPSGWKLWFKTGDQKRQIHQDYLDLYRNNIRSVLMEMTDNVPCYGVPSFTSNIEDHTSVELVRYTSANHAEVLDGSAVFKYIYRMYQYRYGITGQ